MPNDSTRPNYLEVNLKSLKQNLENIRKSVLPAKVMTVLKANAYGHGVDGVAPFIAPFSDYIGVAIVEEGIHLREIGIETPILIMGATLPYQIPLFIEHNLTLAASSMELLDASENAAATSGTRLKVHLKIDTGMERTGIHEYEAQPFLEKSLRCSHLDVEGIFSHFANSETHDLTHARLQLARFQEVLQFYQDTNAPLPPLRHMANSGGILQLQESHFDMVRPGILFYGIYPGPEVLRTVNVIAAATWHSQVAYSKITLPGHPVSYGSLWQATVPSRIVTIPCGYADGYFRRMTNQSEVIMRGKKYPQVGRICMDQFMVNAGEDNIRLGEDVILLGKINNGEKITAEDMARWAGTNEYEIMTNISARVPRSYVYE